MFTRPARGPSVASGTILLCILLSCVALLIGDEKARSAPVADERDVARMARLINDRLAARWKENNVTPSEPASDHEFIRRASLDVIGRIATPEEIRRYLAYPKLTRRAQIVEDLLANEGYARRWAGLWADWLLGRTGVFRAGRYHEEMRTWLEEQFKKNRPYDEIVTDLLTATGKNDENGAVNFILAHVGQRIAAANRAEAGHFDMIPLTGRITQLFLGLETQCLRCHDGPWAADRTIEMFWGVNAFLRQVNREGNIPTNRRDALMTLRLKDDESVNPTASLFVDKLNGRVVKIKATFPPNRDGDKGSELAKDVNGLDRRKALARLVVAHKQFPRAIVNRLWAVFFGRGIVHPFDDFAEINPPSHPELLDELASAFQRQGYDLKKLIRWICNSDAYGLKSRANATNDKRDADALFGRMLLKPLDAEQLFESIVTATRSEDGEKREARRAAWVAPLWEEIPNDEGGLIVDYRGSLTQVLLLMHGDLVNRAVTRPEKGTVAQLMKTNGDSPVFIINELFLATLNREATAAETKEVLGKFRLLKVKDKDPAAPYEDLLWALLNSNEFALNH
jgi:hypothetical protein